MQKKKNAPIAVFDSGMGGISVLRELYRIMPNENYIFFGDSMNAPYGDRSTEEVRNLTLKHTEELLDMGAKGIVIACNTATGAAVHILKEKYKDIPVVGLEPAIKPAVEANPGERILILATELTIHQQKFELLKERFKDQAELIPVGAIGLMNFVEQDKMGTPEIHTFLSELLAPYVENPVKAVVLGCTHYPFVKKDIKDILGDVQFFDGGEGAARRTRFLLEEMGLRNDSKENGVVSFYNSDAEGPHLALSKKLFHLP